MMYVAKNFRVDRATAELGEAFPEIAVAEEAYNTLRSCLERVQRTGSQEADERATEFLELLTAARADSSWPTLFGEAGDAFAEALVTKIERAA